MHKSSVTLWLAAPLMSLLFLASPSSVSGSKDPAGGLTQEDKKAIKATIDQYRAAWLTNDSKGVLRTFTDDAVLLPAHGAHAVMGIAAIERYWFTSGGPPTIITELTITVDQVGGNQGVAFVHGLDSVAWTVIEHGVTHRHSHPGTYLNVMKKLADGSWRIQIHMWDDGPEQVE